MGRSVLNAASLAIKSGNACILRGGSEAIDSNRALAALVQQALVAAGLPADAVQLVPITDRAAVGHRRGADDRQAQARAGGRRARRVAAFVAPMDRYAIVAVSESVVRVWTAKSQSMRAMGRQEFGESIEAVLAFCAGLIGVAPDALKNADAA